MSSSKDRINLTQEQTEQLHFELEESRLIMNKRRKRMPLIEDFNLDEVMNESQKDMILCRKR